MAKKLSPKVNDDEKIDLEVENWQWEVSSRRFTWKHLLAFVLIITVAILFAFGFLIIAAVVFIALIVINIMLFIFKKLS